MVYHNKMHQAITTGQHFILLIRSLFKKPEY